MVNRVFLGEFAPGDYRLRVSRPGYEVTSALGKEQLIFDSAWQSTLLVLAIGSVVVSSPGLNTGVGTIIPNIIVWPNQGFIPVFIPFVGWQTAPGYVAAPLSRDRFHVKSTGVDYVQNTVNFGGTPRVVEYIALRYPEGGVIG